MHNWAFQKYRYCKIEKSKPGLNFTNIFTRSFYASRSQKRKIQSSLKYLFTLLGSACIKALSKMLVKSTPGVNFINIQWAACAWADPKSAKRQSSCQSFVHFWDLHAQKLHVELLWNCHLERHAKGNGPTLADYDVPMGISDRCAWCRSCCRWQRPVENSFNLHLDFLVVHCSNTVIRPKLR